MHTTRNGAEKWSRGWSFVRLLAESLASATDDANCAAVVIRRTAVCTRALRGYANINSQQVLRKVHSAQRLATSSLAHSRALVTWLGA